MALIIKHGEISPGTDESNWNVTILAEIPNRTIYQVESLMKLLETLGKNGVEFLDAYAALILLLDHPEDTQVYRVAKVLCKPYILLNEIQHSNIKDELVKRYLGENSDGSLRQED